MLAYIPYMDPMGSDLMGFSWKADSIHWLHCWAHVWTVSLQPGPVGPLRCEGDSVTTEATYEYQS